MFAGRKQSRKNRGLGLEYVYTEYPITLGAGESARITICANGATYATSTDAITIVLDHDAQTVTTSKLIAGSPTQLDQTNITYGDGNTLVALKDPSGILAVFYNHILVYRADISALTSVIHNKRHYSEGGAGTFTTTRYDATNNYAFRATYPEAGYWPLTTDGLSGGNFLDWSGNGNNGPDNVSGITSADGTDFDAGDDYVQVADSAAIQNIFDGGAWIEFIIEPDSAGEGGNGGRVIDKSANNIFLFDGVGAGLSEIRLYQYFSGTDGWWKSGEVISDGTRYHVIIVYDSSNVANDPTLYLNGTPSTMTEGGTPTGAYTTDVGSDLYIGNRAANDKTFDGHIKNLRMGSGTLTATPAAEFYSQSGL